MDEYDRLLRGEAPTAGQRASTHGPARSPPPSALAPDPYDLLLSANADKNPYVQRSPSGKVIGAPGQPFGELKSYTPSWGDRIRSALPEGLMRLGVEPYKAHHVGGGITDALTTLTPAGAALSAVDLAHDLPAGNLGSAALDAFGALPVVGAGRRMIQGMPQVRPAFTPPPWARVESPDEVAAINAGARSWVTPSTGELSGRGIPGDPIRGVSQRQYEAARNAPVMFHPGAGPHLANQIEQHIQSPAGGYFNQASAPGVYRTVEENLAAWGAHGGPVTPQDLDTLRGQLRNLPPGPEATAGRRASDVVDTFMQAPPAGAVVAGTPRDLAELRRNLENARGNYRAGETAETVELGIDRSGTRANVVHSGTNVGNKTRQTMHTLGDVNIKTKQPNLPYATPDERAALTAASQPGWGENQLRGWGNFLGGGGGLGQLQATGWAGTAGATAGHLMGLDPITTGIVTGGASLGAMRAGTNLVRAANERAVQSAEDAAALIRRNSPEFRERAAQTPEMIDPRSMQRDAIAYALMPQAAAAGKDIWDQKFVPYENRDKEMVE